MLYLYPVTQYVPLILKTMIIISRLNESTDLTAPIAFFIVAFIVVSLCIWSLKSSDKKRSSKKDDRYGKWFNETEF